MAFQYGTAYLVLADSGNEALVRFYAALLGAEPDVQISGVYAEFQLTAMRLGIFQPKAAHQAAFEAPSSGRMSLCFEVVDLNDAIAHMSELGYAPPHDILTSSHGREVHAFDPMGNRIIFYQKNPV